jgi:hypothetical protein
VAGRRHARRPEAPARSLSVGECVGGSSPALKNDNTLRLFDKSRDMVSGSA